jgi:hypothetical protein
MYFTEKGRYFWHFADFSSSDALSCGCWKNNIKSNIFLILGTGSDFIEEFMASLTFMPDVVSRMKTFYPASHGLIGDQALQSSCRTRRPEICRVRSPNAPRKGVIG